MFWVGFACGVGAFLISAALLTLLSERMRRASSNSDANVSWRMDNRPIADTYSTRPLSTYRPANENRRNGQTDADVTA